MDITRWTNVFTDMTTNTLVVIGINITTNGTLIFVNTKNCILRAENYALIALKAHAATHATLAFMLGFLFAQRADPLFKITQYVSRINMDFLTLGTFLSLEVATSPTGPYGR